MRRHAGTLEDPLLSPNGRMQLWTGFTIVSMEPYEQAARRVDNPVACLDCHDPKTMQLRITRPGLLNALEALAASGDPLPHLPSVEDWRKGSRREPYDPYRLASRQEMRSLVCAQCHVEYYCAAKDLLFFPWHKGLKAEQMEELYDEYRFPDGTPFLDWKHKRTGAEVIKVQHPEFELWSQGVHARAGVACADCHMPYIREGAMKTSDHHTRSPLLNVARSCQVCHRTGEEEPKARVAIIQDRTYRLMDRALDGLVALINELEAAVAAGAGDEKLADARRFQRRAQYRVDFVNSENSMGFHAPQEAARLLAEAIDYVQHGRLIVARLQPKRAP